MVRDHMERVSFRLPAKMLSRLDGVVDETNEFGNRSEAIRDALADFVDAQDAEGTTPEEATDEEIAEQFGTDAGGDDGEMLADGGTVISSVFSSRMVQCAGYPHDCSFVAAKSTTNFGLRRWTSFDAVLESERCPECGGEVVRVDV